MAKLAVTSFAKEKLAVGIFCLAACFNFYNVNVLNGCIYVSSSFKLIVTTLFGYRCEFRFTGSAHKIIFGILLSSPLGSLMAGYTVV